MRLRTILAVTVGYVCLQFGPGVQPAFAYDHVAPKMSKVNRFEAARHKIGRVLRLLTPHGDKIIGVRGFEVHDSRSNATVMGEVLTKDGHIGRFKVPSGASTGNKEALEKRDTHNEKRFGGKGVLDAVANVNKIGRELIGMSVFDQVGIDNTMIQLDGTHNKSKFGANAILAISGATAHAAAQVRGVPLYKYFGGEEANVIPVPLMNLLNGGAHALGGLAIQELMIAPHGFRTYAEALEAGITVYQKLKETLPKNQRLVGDEGGFAPSLKNTRAGLQLLVDVIHKAGYEPHKQISLAMDAAASEFFKENRYHIDGHKLSRREHVAYMSDLIRDFNVLSTEDPFHEDDIDSFVEFTAEMGDITRVVGDDLLVTNPELLKKAISERWANALLMKINQIGTLTEARQATIAAQNAGFAVQGSHRSGETADTTLSHITVGWSTHQRGLAGMKFIKTGAPARSDRVEKYNELKIIERDLGSKAIYAGTLLDLDL